MFITPMKGISPINSPFNWENENRENLEDFKSVFSQAMNDVVENEDELAKAEYLLSIGEIEDPHTVPIASATAQLSVDLLVNLRNKAVEAYNEIMRTNL